MWGVAVISILNLEKKGFQEDLPSPSYKARRGNFKRARGCMNAASKPYPFCLGTVMGRHTSGEWCWTGMIQKQGVVLLVELPSLFTYLLFPRVSFIAAA